MVPTMNHIRVAFSRLPSGTRFACLPNPSRLFPSHAPIRFSSRAVHFARTRLVSFSR
ncbi:hypothetical protein BCR44DRAFT_1436741 [Catenaria anguillulae PL171]|uniref:Uncharacterized protein n=1 Tax=Catenaria anguillulae PL171 TaxID=765915 RepID=A0A1Y2HKG6_9FUNG|nr:hypothetical protein BCR44DRAFT_1436741 [Catenaria anguillulae PL171]